MNAQAARQHLEALAWPGRMPEGLVERLSPFGVATAARWSATRSTTGETVPDRPNVMFEGLSREQQRSLKAAHPEGGIVAVDAGIYVNVPRQPGAPERSTEDIDILAEVVEGGR